MGIDLWFQRLKLLIRRTLIFWFKSTRTFVCNMILISSSAFCACPIWFLLNVLNVVWAFLLKIQLNIYFLMVSWRRNSKTLLWELFDVLNAFLLILPFDRFSDHRIFKKSVKDCNTWGVVGHSFIQCWWFGFGTLRLNNWVSSWTRLWAFIVLFAFNWRLETSLNFFFFHSFLLLTKELLLCFSLFYIIIHSSYEVFFCFFAHFLSKFSSVSFNLHNFKFLFKLLQLLFFKNAFLFVFFKFFVSLDKIFYIFWSHLTWSSCSWHKYLFFNFLWSSLEKSFCYVFLFWSRFWSRSWLSLFEVLKINKNKFFCFSSFQIFFHSIIKRFAWLSVWNSNTFCELGFIFKCFQAFSCFYCMVINVKSILFIWLQLFGFGCWVSRLN